MFYVLFTYSKGRKERDFRKFRSEDDLINFLHANYESIDIVQILGAERIYKLGLIETEELAKSTLIRQEIEADLPDPEETKEEEIMRKNKEALQRGEAAIMAAKKDLAKTNTKLIINPAEKPAARRPYKMKEFDKSDWPTCPECHKNPMAPWNKAGRCSECQQYKKISKKTK